MNEESVYNLNNELVGFVLVPAITPKLIEYKKRLFIYSEEKSIYQEVEPFNIMYRTV